MLDGEICIRLPPPRKKHGFEESHDAQCKIGKIFGSILQSLLGQGLSALRQFNQLAGSLEQRAMQCYLKPHLVTKVP